MYTQCTNCKTLFRINEEQLELLEGKVRCGFCYNTFNAYDALYEDIPSDEEDEESEAEWESEEEDEETVAFEEEEPTALDELEELDEFEEFGQNFETPSLPQDLAQEYAAEGVRVNARALSIPTPTPPPPPRPLPAINRLNTPALRTPPPTATPPTPRPTAEPARQTPQARPAPQAQPAPRPQPAPPPARREIPRPDIETPRSAPKIETPRVESPRVESPRVEPPKPAPRTERTDTSPLPIMRPPPVGPASTPAPAMTPAAPAPTPTPTPAPAPTAEPQRPRFDTSVPPMPRDDPAGQLPSLFDAIDLAGRELQQVTRVELDRRRGSHASNWPATIGWGVATIVLIGAILFQVAYFARDELARHTQLRPYLEKMCAVAGCKIPLMRNVSLIKLVSRDIRVHPKIKDALEVRATFTNDATFRQPYPSLRLDLMDASGSRVASRQFEPEEYLANGTDLEAGLAPQQQIDVKLEIMDPEQSAQGFEFSFL